MNSMSEILLINLLFGINWYSTQCHVITPNVPGRTLRTKRPQYMNIKLL